MIVPGAISDIVYQGDIHERRNRKHSLPSAQPQEKNDRKALASLMVCRSARGSASMSGSFILVNAGVKVPGVVPGVSPGPSEGSENGLDRSYARGVEAAVGGYAMGELLWVAGLSTSSSLA